MKHFTTTDFQRWGAIGGAKSKRVLTPAQANAMVAARERKRRKTKQQPEGGENVTAVTTCRVCYEQFTAEVWHCKECNHHWLMSVELCSNCYMQDAPKKPDAMR